MELQPLINGVRHSWSDIEINILGRIVTGITAIKYGSERNIENHYGLGSDPVHRGVGNRTPEASVTLYAYEVEAIQALVPDGNIDKIQPFPIVITYRAEGSDVLVSHTIKGCQFTKNMRDWSQGDSKQEVELPLLPSSIKWK